MGWKFKLFFISLVYVAGFSTAIYLLAPNPQAANPQVENQTVEFESALSKEGLNLSEAQKQQFIQIYNSGLHKGIAISKDAILRLNELIKQKSEQRKLSRAD
jgi:hypothetical protein